MEQASGCNSSRDWWAKETDTPVSCTSFFLSFFRSIHLLVWDSYGHLFYQFSRYLSFNNLKGEIPVELANLPELRYLYLHENRLTGRIPPELGNLKNLRHLYSLSLSLFNLHTWNVSIQLCAVNNQFLLLQQAIRLLCYIPWSLALFCLKVLQFELCTVMLVTTT